VSSCSPLWEVIVTGGPAEVAGGAGGLRADRRTQPRPADEPEDVRLPNGKLQRDEVLKADFQKSLNDARELSKLADELKTDLEKNDRYVLSIPTLKKTEDIEKLAKRIRDRLKH
jgi:hypothetical protein